MGEIVILGSIGALILLMYWRWQPKKQVDTSESTPGEQKTYFKKTPPNQIVWLFFITGGISIIFGWNNLLDPVLAEGTGIANTHKMMVGQTFLIIGAMFLAAGGIIKAKIEN